VVVLWIIDAPREECERVYRLFGDCRVEVAEERRDPLCGVFDFFDEADVVDAQ
jgi:hypothetical protein